MIRFYDVSVAADVSNGIFNGVFLILIGEFLCYLVHGQKLRERDGEYGLVTYLYSRYTSIWFWLAFCSITNIIYVLIGSSSLMYVTAKLMLYSCYPWVMTEAIGLIWGSGDE